EEEGSQEDGQASGEEGCQEDREEGRQEAACEEGCQEEDRQEDRQEGGEEASGEEGCQEGGEEGPCEARQEGRQEEACQEGREEGQAPGEACEKGRSRGDPRRACADDVRTRNRSAVNQAPSPHAQAEREFFLLLGWRPARWTAGAWAPDAASSRPGHAPRLGQTSMSDSPPQAIHGLLSAYPGRDAASAIRCHGSIGAKIKSRRARRPDLHAG